MEECGEQFVAFCGTIGKLELFAPNLDIKLKVLDDMYLYTVQHNTCVQGITKLLLCKVT